MDDEIKELFIEYAMLSEYFVWNILDPEFRYECQYEIETIWPYPELEPDHYYDEVRLTFHVWRLGMAEDESIKCWLSYDAELNRVGFGTEYFEDLLTGIIN